MCEKFVRSLSFSPLCVQKPPCSSLPPPTIHSLTSLFQLCVCFRLGLCHVAETRLQIQERTAREIRQRTAARIAELYREAEDREAELVEEDRAEGCLERQCECCRRFDQLCYRLCCIFFVLFFAYCLYHANQLDKIDPLKHPDLRTPQRSHKTVMKTIDLFHRLYRRPKRMLDIEKTTRNGVIEWRTSWNRWTKDEMKKPNFRLRLR
jgi:hypothetical protein